MSLIPEQHAVTIHISATDNVGVTGYSFDGISFSDQQDMTVTENGTYTGYATDASGNVGSASITIGSIDNIPPAIVDVKKMPEGWTCTSVKVTVTAADQVSEGYAGNTRIEYSLDGQNWRPEGTFEFSDNGDYEIFVRDAAGNTVSVPVSISNIERIAPEISAAQNPTGWTKTGVSLTVSAKDGQSGIPEWAYKWGNGDWNPASLYNVAENGTYTVTVRDGAGNTASYTFHVTQIDRTAPKAEVQLAAGDWHDGHNILLVQASDQESGLAETAYSYDGGATWTSAAEYEITVGGDYLVLVRDAVGNITQCAIHAEKTGIETNIDDAGTAEEMDDTDGAGAEQYTTTQWHAKAEEEVPLTMVQTAAIPVQPTVWQKYSDVSVAHDQEAVVPKIIVSISIPSPAAAASEQTAQQGNMAGEEDEAVKGMNPQALHKIMAVCGICLASGGLILIFFILHMREAVLCQEHDGKYHAVEKVDVERLDEGEGYAVRILDKRICERITEHIAGREVWHYMLRFDKHFAKKHKSEKLKILLDNGSLINTTVSGEVEFSRVPLR
ncbi:MAG: PKD domain-containing protein [Clostridium sp.]|nr:PKD domain-containing protein [Clostridium sp.]